MKQDKKGLLDMPGLIILILMLLAFIGIIGLVFNEFKYFSELHFQIYKNESGNLIKVNEIWFWHEYLTFDINHKAKIQGYEIIEKQDLTIEWLRENCECLKSPCSIYKYEDYIIKTWGQFK